MSTLAGLVILASLITHALLLIFVQARRQRLRAGRFWLSLTLICALLTDGALLLSAISTPGGFLVLVAQVLTLLAYGAVVIHDLTELEPRAWLVGGGLWLLALIAAAAFSNTSFLNQPDWLVASFNTRSALTIVALVGLVVAGLSLLVTEFYTFYRAKLPEVANRDLFWVIDSAVMIIGMILIISRTEGLVLIGQPFAILGVGGAIYAQVFYSVFDIRRELGSAVRTLVLLILTTLVILLALAVANTLGSPNALTFFALALMAAAVYLALRWLIDSAVDILLRSSANSTTEITRLYSQQIAGAVELPMLAEVATHTIDDLLRVRRSALILVNDAGSSDVMAELRTYPGEARPGYVAKDGRLYHQFAFEGTCVLQFDLEFNPDFKIVSESESAFFRETQLAVYAPIVYENALIGILACGAKTNDAPFTVRDLELLLTMAHQTAAALRNARLVADLRGLNEGMQTLNESLAGAKDQMERLDSVKTDFITIASHELRTPLAQIRGYTDILDALNEQDSLDQEQTGAMVKNLRRATERMEELISAMLDVSQLDVNAMDLRFNETSLESVMRMAIEPLTDVIKQRKLTLSARGLRGLPTIQADMQRLVQAFRNVVVNAIKFTPDGGRIEIRANRQPAENPAEQERVLISISDSGVGIDKENLELIFRKFYRAYDPSLHSTGTYKFMGAGPGLGLTIAQGVIAGHGGQIWAESPGHNMETCPGSTFYIVLPVMPPEDARRVLPFQNPALNEQALLRSQVRDGVNF